MNRISSRARWIGLSALTLAAVSTIGWLGRNSQAADDGAAGKPSAGKAAADPFAVPDGKPPALMSFIAKMRRVKPPKNASDDDKKTFLTKSHNAMLEAADKVLDTKPVANLRVAALKAKIEALSSLKELGDDSADKKISDLADELKDEKQPAVAQLAKSLASIVPADAGGKKNGKAEDKIPADKVPTGPRSWAELKPKLAAAPDDKDLVKEAIASVQMMDHGAPPEEAVVAMKELSAILAKSKDPEIAGQARGFEGMIRRLSLPGHPIEYMGNLVDGTPINPAELKGKVVLVDFWATWCGPCKAELPNVLANYEKYHSRGFEVVGVSCDSDKDALLKFIDDKKLPWPIMFQGPGQRSMAAHYGISGIPTAILTNKKGEVVSLNARGDALTQLLGEMLGK